MHMPSFHTVQLNLYGLLPLFRINFFSPFFLETTELFANVALKKSIQCCQKTTAVNHYYYMLQIINGI